MKCFSGRLPLVPPEAGLFILPLLFVLSWSYSGCTARSDRRADINPTTELNKNWEFRQAGTIEWLPASVPGCVHTDLFDAGRIENPFFGDNENSLQWIEQKDWEYRTVFTVGEEFSRKNNIELHFEGLDTYADVYLNEKLILSADNMFREWTINCRDIIKQGKNTLRVYFHSPTNQKQAEWNSLGYELPGGPKVLTRKAGYHYGWDFGPRFVTSGIWRPVRLNAWDKARIKNLQIVQNELADRKAELSAVFLIESMIEDRASLFIFDPDKKNIQGETTVELHPGTNQVQIDFVINNPRLWWTNGLGKPYLYELTGQLELGDDIVSFISERIGIRTVELVTTKDDLGETFYFILNGVPVFMKGANYVPQDNFLPRVRPFQYETLIKKVVESNMNMLRVWGGGIYENDIFYDLCDENGILVWQDFMFACAMYPGEKNFLENVGQEAIQNVKRLRNHPCIALWCGNNEIDEAWHNWGWQSRFSAEDSAEIWTGYDELFHVLLPGIVEELDTGRPYRPSSPKYGRGNSRSLYEGDSHYWGVWHDAEPFEEYKKKTGRFMSEYGFQSFPELGTIRMFSPPEDFDIKSEVMHAHQKHPRGNRLITTYMERDYKIPKDFENFLYVSQVLQAEGMKTAIEAHRRAKPYCMGTLYWQLNDCWPAASWSGIDYYGNRKALHYYAQKAFFDILVSPTVDEGMLRVFIISDRLEPVEGRLTLRLLDFHGGSLWEKSIERVIEPNSSAPWFEMNEEFFLEGKDKGFVVLVAVLYDSEKLLSKNLHYFPPPKDLNLPQPLIQKRIDSKNEGYLIELTSTTLVKNLYLSIDEPDGYFSDNYFDLLPGETMEVLYRTNININNFEEKLKIVSLVDSFD